jgi:hypothetical protein
MAELTLKTFEERLRELVAGMGGSAATTRASSASA